MRSSSPRKHSTEPELYAVALRALMRRSYSVHEMREYLARRAESEEHVGVVLKKLKEFQYLDDARYARDYARIHAQHRHQGKFRIARELRARGVSDKHIEAALEAVFAETDEATLVRSRLERRLRHIKAPLDDPLNQKTRASLYRNLLRAGFSSDVIRAELRAATKAAAGVDDSVEEES
ncbi:MAG TPA: regulatory protein RecX [Candidatus Angelobacter sp.]|nr:regulatory protein RecX [Candidatus Angelobacter sp.]